MTCREKLRLEHPDRLDHTQYGGTIDCPKDYGYMDQPDWCRINDATCTRCWDREIPERDVEDPGAKYLAHRLAALRIALLNEGFTREEALKIILCEAYKKGEII